MIRRGLRFALPDYREELRVCIILFRGSAPSFEKGLKIKGIEGIVRYTMVNNLKKVLDEGNLKCVHEVNMPKQKNTYELYVDTKYATKTITEWDERSGDMKSRVVDNEKYIVPTARFLYADKKWIEYEQQWDYVNWPKGPDYKGLCNKWTCWAGGEEAICESLGIIPFIPSVMINVSPDWGGEDIEKVHARGKIRRLSEWIESYLEEGWYSKASYVIENGSDGNNIHAHIVAEFKKDRLLSGVNSGKKSHIGQQRPTTQLKKYANKMKGMKGVIKGNSVQLCILRNEVLVSDKLDYLIEEKKPKGHKNHSVIFEKKDLVF